MNLRLRIGIKRPFPPHSYPRVHYVGIWAAWEPQLARLTGAVSLAELPSAMWTVAAKNIAASNNAWRPIFGFRFRHSGGWGRHGYNYCVYSIGLGKLWFNLYDKGRPSGCILSGPARWYRFKVTWGVLKGLQ